MLGQIDSHHDILTFTLLKTELTHCHVSLQISACDTELASPAAAVTFERAKSFQFRNLRLLFR